LIKAGREKIDLPVRERLVLLSDIDEESPRIKEKSFLNKSKEEIMLLFRLKGNAANMQY